MNKPSLAENELSIRVLPAASQSALAVNGRVTVDSSPRLRSALLKLLRSNTQRVLVVDLSRVSYLDVSGIATLVEALKVAHEQSVKLRLEGMSGQPRMIMEVIEMDKILRESESETILN